MSCPNPSALVPRVWTPGHNSATSLESRAWDPKRNKATSVSARLWAPADNPSACGCDGGLVTFADEPLMTFAGDCIFPF